MIDYTIAAQVQPPKSNVNALEMLGQLAQTQNMLNQSKLFQQQFGGNVATGQAYAKAIQMPEARNPDGTLNRGRVEALTTQIMAREYPESSYTLPQFQNQLLQNRNTELSMDKAGLELNLMRTRTMGGALQALRNDPSPQTAMSILSNLVGQQVIPGPQAKQIFDGMMLETGGNPEAISKWANTQGAALALNAEQLLSMTNPAPQELDTGTQKQLLQTNRLTGATSVLGSAQKGAAPDTLAQIGNNLVQGTTPEGLPYKAPQGTMFGVTAPQGGGFVPNPLMGPGAVPMGGGIPAARPSNTPKISPPVAPSGVAAPTLPANGQPAPTAQNSAPTGGVLMGPSEALAEYRKKAADAFQTKSTDLAGRVQRYDESLRTIETMNKLLDQIQTGPGAATYGEIAKALEALPGNVIPKRWIDGLVGNADNKEKQTYALEAFQALNKLLFDQTMGELTSSLPADAINKSIEQAKLGNTVDVGTLRPAIDTIFSKMGREAAMARHQLDARTEWAKTAETRGMAPDEGQFASYYAQLARSLGKTKDPERLGLAERNGAKPTGAKPLPAPPKSQEAAANTSGTQATSNDATAAPAPIPPRPASLAGVSGLMYSRSKNQFWVQGKGWYNPDGTKVEN